MKSSSFFLKRFHFIWIFFLPQLIIGQSPLLSFNDELVTIVERATPSVVTIKTEKTLKVNYNNPFGGSGFFESWFGSPREYEYNQKGMGSGVIVSSEGYVITNNHVIQDADKLFVKTNSGAELEATILGVDPRTDIAVLKITPYNGMKIVQLGNSDFLRVGEMVLAIGSPLEEQLSQTVTMGIVSAKGRSNVGMADFEDFIQTDAAINPGNSGGALINMKGELIGINTAIISRSGGNQGIGFAIPINMVKNVMESILKYGKVVRGYSGIFVTNMSEELAAGVGLEGKSGVLVNEVDPEGPGFLASLQPGDIIVKMNGKETNDAVQFRSRIATLSPDSEVELEVFQKGKKVNKKLKLVELPIPGQGASFSTFSKYFLGFQVMECTPELRAKYKIPEYDGLLVTEVVENGNASKGGLQPGDVLLMVDNKAIKTTDELAQLLKGKKEADIIRLKIWRAGVYYYLNVELG